MTASPYDRLAGVYGYLERVMFARRLDRCRRRAAELLPPKLRRVVVLGGGRGVITRMILDAWPNAEVSMVDSSGEMIRRARARTGDRGTMIRQDFRTLDVSRFDVVVLPFAMDCLSEADMDRMLDRWRDQLAPGARVLWLDFVHTSGKETLPGRRPADRLRLWLMHRFFGLVTGHPTSCLVDMPAVWRRHGFVQTGGFVDGIVAAAVWEPTPGSMTPS